MTFSIRVSSFVSVRQFGHKYFKAMADLEPFPGALITMNDAFKKLTKNNKVKYYSGRIEDILESGKMQGVSCPAIGGRTRLRTYYKLTGEEIEWLQEIRHLINWGQSNSFWLDIGEDGRASEQDFQTAKLNVSAI